MLEEKEITVYGRIQGVGFRPFVAEQAESLRIVGTVKNIGGIVRIHASGEKEALNEFVHRLSACPKPGARVDRVTVKAAGKTDGEEEKASFQIIESEPQEDVLRFLPPDMATCDSCIWEMFDRKNRRYRYPFISCTVCGPRFSIMERVPYDRDTITMRDFAMCPVCGQEYRRKGDIRRHAQTIACKDCGPTLRLYRKEEVSSPSVQDREAEWKTKSPGGDASPTQSFAEGERAIRDAASLLREGKIVAIKDIGGFHFACRTDLGEPAMRLREFKNRERKPFAVMFSDLSSIEAFCEVSKAEKKLLQSDARPIVLLRKKSGRELAPEVCGESDRIGAFLPCNPLQILLLRETGALVMTSGNRGGEPIRTREEEIFAYWDGQSAPAVPDAVLTHDRRILYGLDDSIYQVTDCGGREVVQVIRRGRGLVPEPVELSGVLSEDVFAAGGDLKAVFALGRKHMAYLSGHFGDLGELSAAESRRQAIAGMEGLFGIHPERFLCDQHPGYISSGEIRTKDRRMEIQHHHAHAAAVIAEHGLQGRVLGVVYDGTGYSEDGTIWGGEFLLCEKKSFFRAGHWESVQLTGGDTSARHALATAYCYLYAAVKKGILLPEEMERISGGLNSSQKQLIRGALEHQINTVWSSSMGRLFDAAAAILGICTENSYEGECPEKLQIHAERQFRSEQELLLKSEHHSESAFPSERRWEREEWSIPAWYMTSPKNALYRSGEVWIADGVSLIAALAKGYLAGRSAGELALAFHKAVVAVTVEMCRNIAAKESGEHRTCFDASGEKSHAVSEKSHAPGEKSRMTVALGGGTMYNGLLLKLMLPALEKSGMQAYINEKVPSGDGGLAYGQLYLATDPAPVRE